PDSLEIPEGSRVNVDYKGKNWEIPLPRYGGSYYHLAKSHASLNADYANRIWGLKITDICQGIVYGHYDGSSFYYDSIWGTVFNRFITQAVAGIPLTIYGKGGQMRSFININNSIQAIKLLIDNPPEEKEFRIIHQITELYKVEEVARMVQDVTKCDVQYIDNPRAEQDYNEFKFNNNKLKTLGLETIKMDSVIQKTFDVIRDNKDKIDVSKLLPNISWK
ncbi:MAG: NAD-dependent epimerase/dehydratase family protein, partial [Candidatus Paceibacterota bacterium]